MNEFVADDLVPSFAPSLLLPQAYWRIAGMSYLKYSNMCAEVVRGCLKEPWLTKVRTRAFSPRVARSTSRDRSSRSIQARVSSAPVDEARQPFVHPLTRAPVSSRIPQAKPREAVYMKHTKWADGKPSTPGAS